MARDGGANAAKTCWFERMQQERGHAASFYASEGWHAEISAPFSLCLYPQGWVFPQKGLGACLLPWEKLVPRSPRGLRVLCRHLWLPGELASVAASFR